jgi:outer membrane immunogenic protein
MVSVNLGTYALIQVTRGKMKRIILLLILFVAASAIFAQCPVAKGQAQFNGGVGFSSWGVPIYMGLDYGIHKDVTLGGELSFNSYREKYANHYYNHTITGISGNCNYHFNHILNIPQDWDFYAGLNLGFYIWKSPDNYYGSHSSGLDLGAQIGGRYYFTETVGVNLEFGGGNAFSAGKIGVSVKL